MSSNLAGTLVGQDSSIWGWSMCPGEDYVDSPATLPLIYALTNFHALSNGGIVWEVEVWMSCSTEPSEATILDDKEWTHWLGYPTCNGDTSNQQQTQLKVNRQQVKYIPDCFTRRWRKRESFLGTRSLSKHFSKPDIFHRLEIFNNVFSRI